MRLGFMTWNWRDAFYNMVREVVADGFNTETKNKFFSDKDTAKRIFERIESQLETNTRIMDKLTKTLPNLSDIEVRKQQDIQIEQLTQALNKLREEKQELSSKLDENARKLIDLQNEQSNSDDYEQYKENK